MMMTRQIQDCMRQYRSGRAVHRAIRAGVAALCLAALLASGARAQRTDEGPILTPHKPTTATLVVSCDLRCTWMLDGKGRGTLEAYEQATTVITPGNHMISAFTEDGMDAVDVPIQIKGPGRTVKRLELEAVRDARLRKGGHAPVNPPETHQPAANEGNSDDLHAHAADRFSQAMDLYKQNQPDKAKELLTQACDGDNASACNNLGVLFYDRDSSSRDYARARSLYQKACTGGSANGCDNLGILTENGQGGAQDSAQAFSLYVKGCDGGSMDGCDNAGRLYESGQGTGQNYSLAMSMYHKACDGGEMNGCANLGGLYDNGHGVAQDYAQARSLYQKACDGGAMTGCTNLGYMYDNGTGVTQDKAQARALYQKGCEGGSMAGCNDLGVFYEYGDGVQVDKNQARTLYKKACDGGLQKGCENLSQMQ